MLQLLVVTMLILATLLVTVDTRERRPWKKHPTVVLFTEMVPASGLAVAQTGGSENALEMELPLIFQLIGTVVASSVNVLTTRMTLWSLLRHLGVCIFTGRASGRAVVQDGMT